MGVSGPRKIESSQLVGLTTHRSRRRTKLALLAVTLLVSVQVRSSYALTGGPQPPDFQSPSSPESEEMVDKFTGDFRKSIAVLELPGPGGGYTFNLSYSSGASMEQEASWVGLGWTLNPGAINRQMRGLPDEFNADEEDKVTTINDTEENVTWGLGVAVNLELFGLDTSVGLPLSAGLDIYYNNQRGFGYTRNIGAKGSFAGEQSGMSGSVGLNLSLDSQEGLTAAPSLSVSDYFSANASLNSVSGLSSLSFGVVIPKMPPRLNSLSYDVSSFLGYAKPVSIPPSSPGTRTSNVSVRFKLGGEIQGMYLDGTLSGFYTAQLMKNRAAPIDDNPYGYFHLEKAGEDALLDFNREKDGQIHDNTPNLAIPIPHPRPLLAVGTRNRRNVSRFSNRCAGVVR